MIFMLLFPHHVAGLQVLRPALTPLFEVQQIPLPPFDFSITYPDKKLFLKYKNPALF